MVSVNRIEKKQPKAAEAPSGRTGIPKAVQAKFETASGLSFEDVRVHYNSSRPAQLGAYAYTRGSQVYIGPGQERYLEHELGHVVQQKRGLVKPDGYINGLPVNRDPKLERAADAGANQPVQGVFKSGDGIVQMMLGGRGQAPQGSAPASTPTPAKPAPEPAPLPAESLWDDYLESPAPATPFPAVFRPGGRNSAAVPEQEAGVKAPEYTPGAQHKVPTDLFAFGNRSGVRPPRYKGDFHLRSEEEFVGPGRLPFPDGASSFSSVENVSLTGYYYKLSQGTMLPEELGVVADGRDVNGKSKHAEGHHTIYPAKQMPFREFATGFSGLGWTYGGKKPAEPSPRKDSSQGKSSERPPRQEPRPKKELSPRQETRPGK